jgi:hypothetical protein
MWINYIYDNKNDDNFPFYYHLNFAQLFLLEYVSLMSKCEDARWEILLDF